MLYKAAMRTKISLFYYRPIHHREDWKLHTGTGRP